MKVIVFGSSSTGNMDGFAARLTEHEESVSVTVDDGFNFEDQSSYRVLHQIEPPEVLDCVDRIIANHKFYDLILAWHPRILEECSNAVLFPQSVCTWMTFENGSHIFSSKDQDSMEVDATKKEYKVSFLTSSKAWTPGHIVRQEIYEMLPAHINNLRIDKVKSPPWVDKKKLLDTYQFTITPQNASHNNWFDDKIVDSLMAKTIPLFWGCPNIGDFFNLDGILHFRTIPELMSLLATLTPDYYQQHYAAVQDNYRRARDRVHIWSRMDNEITAGIARRNSGGRQHSDAAVLAYPKTAPIELEAKSMLGTGTYRPLARKSLLSQ